jgi:hypothetical protein
MVDGHIPTPPPSTPPSPPWPHWPATQLPLTHTAPAAQALPHAPQFWLSVWVFAQAFPHSAYPVPMASHAWQVPPMQARCPCVHAVPQPPQESGSELRFLQIPWQSLGKFPGQTQAADWHCLPPVQVTPHPPQFCGSEYG